MAHFKRTQLKELHYIFSVKPTDPHETVGCQAPQHLQNCKQHCYNTLYSKYSNFYQYAQENQYILTIFCCLKQKPDEETFPISGF